MEIEVEVDGGEGGSKADEIEERRRNRGKNGKLGGKWINFGHVETADAQRG